MARAGTGAVAFWETNSLDEHVALIARQVNRGLQDAETQKLAVKLISGRYDEMRDGKPVVIAWGKPYWMPQVPPCAQGNDECESTIFWNFVVLNIRYVLDPDGYDQFNTLRYTLEAGGGDCDDMVIALVTLHRAVGFVDCRGRVVSAGDSHWEHIYTMVGFPKARPKRLVALDPTVQGATPGWEYQSAKKRVDFRL